ncbi:MAG: MFS transporter [Nitrospinota bacterium]|nr:MAG: MFS transporter [Nitrospinota bacterium]
MTSFEAYEKEQSMRNTLNPTSTEPHWFHRLPFFYGWVVLAVATLGIFTTGPAQTYSVSVFLTPILGELHLSRTAVSSMYALGTVVAAFAPLFIGYCIDRFGSQVVIILAALLLGIACFWLSLADSLLDLFFGFAAIRMLAIGALSLACTTLVAQWFVRRRGVAMSIANLGMAGNSAVFPPLSQMFIDTYGWRGAWRGLGLVIWGLLLLPATFLIRNRPEVMGLHPDGDEEADKAQASVQAEKPRVVELNWTARQALRTRTFWLLLYTAMVSPTVVTALTLYQIAFLVERGFSPHFAASVFSVRAIVHAVVTFSIGFVLDRVPARYVLAGGLGVLIAAMGALLQSYTPLVAILYGALTGVTTAVTSTTHSVIWANYYGRRHLGSIQGISTAVFIGGTALGSLPLAIAYDFFGGYAQGVVALMILPLLGIVAVLSAPPPTAADTPS